MFMHLGMVGSSFKGIKIAGLAVLFTVLAAFNPRPFRAANAGVNIIVIDPGHGGKDPGNLGKIYRRKSTGYESHLDSRRRPVY
jgi:N-acetylmuramoyl-L-alanine amidase